MKIKKMGSTKNERYLKKHPNTILNQYLSADSKIYFDEEWAFCRRPYVLLSARKEERLISIGIYDYDDFDISVLYMPDEESFIPVLHELINWMVDHEKGISSYDTLIHQPFDFFPDCNCARKMW